MKMLLYEVCLLTTKDNGKNFGIAGFQTDNIFNVRIEVFMEKKETEIIKTKFKAKTQIILKTSISRDFNNCHMTIKAESSMVV